MIDTDHILIATNVGLIITVLLVTIRMTWFLSKMDSRIDTSIGTAVRAHKRIDLIEKEIKELS